MYDIKSFKCFIIYTDHFLHFFDTVSSASSTWRTVISKPTSAVADGMI